MYENRLYPGATIVLILLLLSVLLPVSLAGCDGQASGQKDKDPAPFYDDRVVTVRFTIPEDDWEHMQENALAEQYVKADMSYDGELIPDIALRPKGNSSLMTTVGRDSVRFSLKADLNFFNTARNLYGVKKLNFNNGFSDPTFMRETLAYDLFRQMGVPAPRTSFVDLWINDTHMGLYTMVEHVDATFLSNHFDDGTGNLYKPEMPAAALSWTEADYEKQQSRQNASEPTDDSNSLDINLGGGRLSEIMRALGQEGAVEEESAAPRFPILPPEGFEPPYGFEPPEGMEPPAFLRPPAGFEPPEGMRLPRGMMPGNQRDFTELMGLKTNENKPNYSGLFRFLDILNNEPDATFQQEIEKVLDVDRVLRFLAVCTTVVHLDNYTGMFGHNYYLYEVDGKFTVLPWDLNMAFGTFNSGLDRKGIIDFLIDEPTAVPVADRPLVSRLLSVPAYLETYHGYLSEIIDGPFSYEVMEGKINELADMIRPYVKADTLKFFTTRDFEINLREGIRPRRAVPGMQLSIGLKAFMRERVKSIELQLDGMRPSTNNGKGNVGIMQTPGFPNIRANLPPRT